MIEGEDVSIDDIENDGNASDEDISDQVSARENIRHS